MKKRYALIFSTLICLIFTACGQTRQPLIFDPNVKDRTNAVQEIDSIEYSTTEITGEAEMTSPHYFEVVAASTTAPPAPTTPNTPPKKYYMVKFVDYDGYSMLSVQNVAEGEAAKEPPIPERRGDLYFRGWDKDFSSVKQNMIVKAIYQKEVLTVRFFDVDGKLLKEEAVFYGEDATPPEFTPPDGYVLAGWTRSYKNITNDIDLYASYAVSPKNNAITLIDAYKLLTVKENTLKLPVTSYYRKEHTGICTLNGEDYAGNILYGNFSDRLELSGYGFTALEGMIGLKEPSSNVNDTEYELVLYIHVDGELKVQLTLNETGKSKDFAVDLSGAKYVTIRLEPYVDGELYYINADFIGGIVDAIIY